MELIAFCQSDLPCTSFVAFEDMRRRGQLCDLTITVQNKKFIAHRVIVAAGIPFFRSMLTSTGMKAEEMKILMEDLDPKALELLIDFAYSSKVNISFENVHSLLLASHLLELYQVRDACVTFLSRRLHVNNVIQARTVALTVNNSELIEICNSYIRRNFEKFSKSESFLSLPYSHVKEIISEDYLTVGSEETVFEAVITWVKISPSERHVNLLELLSDVRMVYLPTDYLITQVDSEELVRVSIPCKDLVNEVKNYHLSKNKSAYSNLKTHPRNSGITKADIYAVCFNGDTHECSVYCSDFVNERWLNISSKTVSGECYRWYAVAVNGKLYMFLIEKIQTFHLTSHKWEELEVRHRGIDMTCILSYGNVIYFFGSDDVAYSSKVRCFDTAQNDWMEERIMPTTRWGAAAASLQQSIYVTGGKSGNACVDAVEKYNPSTDQWTRVASMITARRSHGCVAANAKIYVCGGWTPVGDRTCTAEVYDPVADQWNFISPMSIKRSTFALLSDNTKICALGGSSVEVNDTLEVEGYDPESDHWKLNFRVPEGFRCAVSYG